MSTNTSGDLIVRRASAPRQIHLQKLLGLPTPDYLHLPVALNAQREKLSKQTFAASADVTRPVPLLCQLLHFLGQEIPPGLADGSLADFLALGGDASGPDACPACAGCCCGSDWERFSQNVKF